MIPLRDENPALTVPYVVYGLIALNLLVYLYNGALTPESSNPLAGYQLIPYELVTGRRVAPPIPVGFWATIFTSMFIHVNLLHLGGNMLYLWVFGNNIEDVLGHFRFLVFYLVAGAGAAAAQIAVNPLSKLPMVGASGAIAGVLAAYLLLFPRARVISLVVYFVVALPAYIVLGLWIVLQVINSLVIVGSGTSAQGGIAFFAHVGGFATGLVFTLLLGGGRLRGRRRPVEYYAPDGL